MTPRPLWQLAVQVAPEAEDAASEWLNRIYELPVTGVTDLEARTTRVSVYADRKALFTPARRKQLAAGLRAMAGAGLDIGAGRITLRRIRREDWAESWKRHFQPLAIGRALLIKPSWSKRRPRAGQAVVVLDPGLSFGTGRHPTTRFCLEQAAARRQRGERQAFLDIGTGSGILAIAAVRLGYAPVEAFDFDPDAVRIARANARSNGVLPLLRLARRDLTRWPAAVKPRFDVICANLIYDLLLQERRRILRQLKPAGTLVLAGILRTQFPAVRRAYEAEGLRLVRRATDGEWESGAFAWKPPRNG